MDEYENLKTELLLNNKDLKRVEKYRELFKPYYESLKKEYNKKFKKANEMEIALDKEALRLQNLIDIVEARIKEVANLEKEYRKITKEGLENNDIMGLDRLNDYKEKLKNINIYLETLNEYKEIDSESRELKEELLSSENMDNSVYKQVKENEKKLDKLYSKVITPEIIAILYEFCIIDTYNLDELDRSMVFNERKEIIIRKEKIVEKEVNKGVEVTIDDENNNKVLTEIPMVPKLGTVNPTNKMQIISEMKKENPDIVLPDLGLTDNETEISLNNSKYLDKQVNNK